MAAGVLRGYLDGTRAGALWLEYDSYAQRVFANGAADWLSQPSRFANTMVQARKAIRSDVVTVDITAAALASMPAGDDPVERCRMALGDEAGRRFAADCIDAILHKLAREIDLVLRVPSPRNLLMRCGQEGEPDFDQLDEVATAIVSSLRTHADRNIGGLLLTRDSSAPLSADEADAHGPVLNAAHHYGWVTCLSLPGVLVAGGTVEVDDVDLLLCGDLPQARIRALRGQGRALGGGIPPALWSATGEVPTRAADDLLFGVVPVDANPETVLARCASLSN
ncbi:MAG: hypothetical protein AB7O21_07950 [Gammaproteobacteria bacterium]